MGSIKRFLESEIADLREELSVIEYVSWWAIRALQIISLVKLIITDIGNQATLLLFLNFIVSFTVPLVRLLLFPKRIFKRLSFHCQTWLNVMVFFGSFLTHGLGWNHTVASWDKILHFMAGAVILFIGNGVAGMLISENDRVSPLFRTFAATGFSYIAMVVWEVFEFFVDFYWAGSNNQAYNINPERDKFFFMIFGQGAQNENQWAVFDTGVDMLCAIVGSIPAAIALYFWLKRKQQKDIAVSEKETVSAQ